MPKLAPLTFGHYGTRVRCQKLAPSGGLTLALHGNYSFEDIAIGRLEKSYDMALYGMPTT